jgi:hypothetical protein
MTERATTGTAHAVDQPIGTIVNARWMLGAGFALGIVLLLVSIPLYGKDADIWRLTAHHVTRDIGLALVIGVFIAFTLEKLNSAEREREYKDLSERIAKDVHGAILKTNLPKAWVDYFLDLAREATHVNESCDFTFKITRVPDRPDLLFVTLEGVMSVRRLTDSWEYPFSTYIEEIGDPAVDHHVQITRVSVDDTAFTKEEIASDGKHYRREGVTVRYDRKFHVESERFNVKYKVQTVRRLHESFVWSMMRPSMWARANIECDESLRPGILWYHPSQAGKAIAVSDKNELEVTLKHPTPPYMAFEVFWREASDKPKVAVTTPPADAPTGAAS